MEKPKFIDLKKIIHRVNISEKNKDILTKRLNLSLDEYNNLKSKCNVLQNKLTLFEQKYSNIIGRLDHIEKHLTE